MSDKLDLAFVMDCTGSMDKYISSATRNIENIVRTLSKSGIGDIRFALVKYRDHPPQDNTFVTKTHDFTTGVATMKLLLDACSANGGGDEPEAVADALQDCLNLSWRQYATKMSVLISDAPPHGIISSECPAGYDPMEISFKMARKGITLYVAGCEPSINSYKDVFMAMAFMTGGKYIPLYDEKFLSNVIVGGAQEEISLEKWIPEVDDEIHKITALEENKDEGLVRAVYEKMKLQGASVKHLQRNKKAVGEMSQRAKNMSKLRKISDVKNFPSEGSYVPNPEKEAIAASDVYSVEEGTVTLEQVERLVQKSKARGALD